MLGATKREDGYLEGNGYVVSWCVGHLVELAQPVSYTHLDVYKRQADFILSLCELIMGSKDGLQPIEKTVIDRCVHQIYQRYSTILHLRICRSLRICMMPF